MTVQRERVLGPARLLQGDAVAIMRTLDVVDHVIGDPPYEKEAHAAGRRVLAATRKVIEDPLDFEAMTAELRQEAALEMVRLSRGWVLAFCQVEAVAVWRAELEGAGAAWRRAMVWVKPDGSPQLSGDRPAQGYECIATAWAGTGRSTWNGGGRAGVFFVNKHDPGMGHGGPRNPHPTMKPVKIMRALIDLFTKPGDVVLDPFMGSGTTGVAAVEMGRRFIGIEARPDYFDLAVSRIGGTFEQGELQFSDKA